MSARYHNIQLGVRRRLKNLAFGHASAPFFQDISGLIHVGANYGQEAKDYNKLGINVLWIEALPDVHRILCTKIKNYSNQSAISALITDIDGKEYEFNISNNNGLSSSIFHLKGHKDIWPGVFYNSSIKLKSHTLNSVILNNNLNPADYQALVLDTQGSELLVLKGCIPLLHNLKYIKTEVADFDAYDGGCQFEELNQFITSFGFIEISRTEIARRKQGGSYYNIEYKKIQAGGGGEVFDID